MPICESSTPNYGGSSGGVGNPSGTTETNGKYKVDFSGWWGYDKNAQATNTRYIEEFQRAGKALNIDWRMISALAQQESGYDTNSCNSVTSGCGLYQFLDDTWDQFSTEYKQQYDKKKNSHIATNVLIKMWDFNKTFVDHVQNINDRVACLIQGHHDGHIKFKSGSSRQKWQDLDFSQTKSEGMPYLSIIIEKYHKLCK